MLYGLGVLVGGLIVRAFNGGVEILVLVCLVHAESLLIPELGRHLSTGGGRHGSCEVICGGGRVGCGLLVLSVRLGQVVVCGLVLRLLLLCELRFNLSGLLSHTIVRVSFLMWVLLVLLVANRRVMISRRFSWFGRRVVIRILIRARISSCRSRVGEVRSLTVLLDRRLITHAVVLALIRLHGLVLLNGIVLFLGFLGHRGVMDGLA